MIHFEVSEGGRPARFRATAETVAQRLGEETVLVHIKTDRIFVLNRTGARFWELLCGDHDRAEIQRRMRMEFDVGDTELAAEIDRLLGSLQDEQLIERIPPVP